MKFDAVIIGSGLGGLECAYILAKNGKKVCVVEKNAAPGGCLQSFRRGTDEFDTGFHYVGALGKGQILERLFSYFNLMKLPWHQLDTDGFDQVVFQDKSYLLCNGYENFADSLSSRFPESQAEICKYSAFLKEVGSKITDPLFSNGGWDSTNSLFSLSAWEYLRSTLKNSLVRDIASGTSLKLELCRQTLPLYTFAQINSSFIQSAWRLKGRGSLIAESLSDSIRKMGGTIMLSTEAIVLSDENSRVSRLKVRSTKGGLFKAPSESDCQTIEADCFISDLSPQLTLQLLKDSPAVRPVFRRRISRLEQTYGFFTVNIKLKPEKVKYLNRNVYYYSPDLSSVWDIPEKLSDGRTRGILISQQVPEQGPFATQMDILAPMGYKEVEQWENTFPLHRGEKYREFKARKAEECLQMAEEVFPHLRESVDTFYTSTPLTYRDYTGAVQGTAYGIRKDCNNLIMTLLAPKTPLGNLYFTGQNLNLHGVLGVSLTSLITCSEILGKEPVVSFLE
ncbi:MAG: NAD(P)/FAD-dependent oxidoreductase [Bacteroidales bacterium]|nr:NAD(P)/FAD-dependent oxidoreductase [Bacteroidales bacterium]